MPRAAVSMAAIKAKIVCRRAWQQPHSFWTRTQGRLSGISIGNAIGCVLCVILATLKSRELVNIEEAFDLAPKY